MDELPGSRFDNYIIEDELGRGGMAIVYGARHVRLDRVCAIKILRPELADDERFVDRFLREAQRAAQLEHPHIVPIYDTGNANRFYFIAMKFLPGRTLRQLMDQGPLEPPQIADYLTQAASALDYAHSKGIVHRDIKPGNMVIDNQRFLTLTDFGLARASDDMHLTVTGTLMGTPAYMAPEQVQGKTASAQTDVYQLGIVAYELLCGETPWGKRAPFALLNAHLHETPPPLHEKAPELPPELNVTIERALAKEPEDRYPTAGAFIATLVQQIPGAEAWSQSNSVFEPDETDRLYRSAVAGDATTRPTPPLDATPTTDQIAPTPARIKSDEDTTDPEQTSVEVAALGLGAAAVAGAAGAAAAGGAAGHAGVPADVTQGATVYETQPPPPHPGFVSGQWGAGAAVGAGAAAAGGGGGYTDPPTYAIPAEYEEPRRPRTLYLLLAGIIALFLVVGVIVAGYASGLIGGDDDDPTATPTEAVVATGAATESSTASTAPAVSSATATEEAEPSATSTRRPTNTPRPLPTATPSPSTTATATPSPTPEPTATPEPTPTTPPPPTNTPVPPPPPPTNTPVPPPPPPPPTNTPVPPPPPPTATSPPPPTATQITVPTVGP